MPSRSHPWIYSEVNVATMLPIKASDIHAGQGRAIDVSGEQYATYDEGQSTIVMET